MTDERIMIFIDGSNWFFAMKEMKRRYQIEIEPFDYYKFSKLLTRNRKLVRTYYYGAKRPESDAAELIRAQKNYFSHIQQTPFCNLRLGQLVKRHDTMIEKGVDVLLSVDLIRLARQNCYDTAILVSGDGDFTAAVTDVKDQGKQVELAFVPFSQAQTLRQECDQYTEITPLMLTLCRHKNNNLEVVHAR